MDTPVVTDLVELNFATLPANFTGPAHLHHFHQLDTILEGCVTVEAEGARPLRAAAGDGWLIPPLARHGYHSRRGYRQGSFKFHLAPRYWSLFGTKFRPFKLSSHLLEEMEAVVARCHAGAPLARQQALAVATLCLVELLEQIPAEISPVAPNDNLEDPGHFLWPLLERIENAPHADWSVAWMAQECHLSPDYFARRFHRALGQTPQHYLLQARMRAAAAGLLAVPPRPIKEIAEAARYSTVHAFSRAFRQVFGSSPAAYRNARREF